ncbi:hypothetical protein M9Y10_017214 [Tritrichomonas musculus]|uniref:Uncharacterized protein n=1 Tax=Tritrichomonas musculus TaxID=1915356 RepID=A0ABR2HVJ6_9EUKA
MMYFEGDPRPYLRFKKNPNDTKDTVCCKCKFIDQQGNRFMCNYEKRIDHHRKAIKEKNITFVLGYVIQNNKRILETLPKKRLKMIMMKFHQLHSLTNYVYWLAA